MAAPLQETISRHQRAAPMRDAMPSCAARRLAWRSTLLTMIVLAGCGPSTDRLAISGKVLLDGAPLDSGSIRFSSVGSEKLFATGAMIQNGAYEVPQEHGLPPGAYHVEIYSPDSTAPPVMARSSPGGPGIPVAPDRIPEEYNAQSTKTIEVTPDADNHFVFEISSKSAN